MSDVTVEFGAKIDELLRGVSQAKTAIESVRESTDRVADGARRMAEIFGVALTAEGVKTFVESMARLGEQAENTMARLALTAQGFTTMDGIARVTGTSMDGLTTAIERVSLNIQRARSDAFDPAAQGLKVLGLSARDFAGLKTEDYFVKLADAVSKFNPSLNLTNALMAVGGRGVTQILPLLRQGAEGWRALEERVRAARDGLAAAIPGMADTHVKLALMGLSVQSLGARIFSTLKPALDWAVEGFTSWVQSIKSEDIRTAATTVVNVMSQVVISLGTMFKQLSDLIEDAITDMDRFIAKIKVVAGYAGAGAIIGGAMGGPGGAVVGGLIGGAVGAGNLDAAFSDRYESGVRAIERQSPEWVRRVQEVTKKITDAINASSGGGEHGAAGGGGAAAAINLGAKSASDAARARIEGERAVATEILAQWKEYYDQLANLDRMSNASSIAAYREKVDQFFQYDQSLLQKELALYPKRSQEWERINAQILQLQQKHNTEMMRLTNQQVLAIKNQYGEFFDALRGSWDGQLRGLLSGQQKFSQVWKTILGDMLIFFIQWVEKKVMNYLLGLAAEKAADTAATGAKVAAAGTEAAATLPIRAAKFLSDITADAAATFAGVFAFLAPLMGPAAAGPAAVASATVGAQAVAVPKLDVGTDMVLSDGLAMIHRGERVVPAAQTSGPYTGRGGAGGDTHVHVHAWDAGSVAKWLKRGGAEIIASAVAKTQNKQPSTRASF